MANLQISLQTTATLVPFFQKKPHEIPKKSISYINPGITSNKDLNVWRGRLGGYNFASSNKKTILLITKKLTIMTNKIFFNESVAAVINAMQTRWGKMARVFIVVAAMAVVSTSPATGQVRLGVKGGITTTELRDKSSLLDKGNHTAYTGGLMVDLNIPKVNLGLEVSALYRQNKNAKMDNSVNGSKNHCIDIPVHVRYRLAIPGVEKVVAPCVFTGPNMSVIIKDRKGIQDESSNTRMSWDVGAGVDLFNHLRVTASYGIGMKKAMKYIGQDYDGHHVEGKDNCWTVSAAFMF